MTWTRLADEFPRHPKIVAAGLEGHALIVGALCYANGYLTRGIVAANLVPTLSPLVKPAKAPRVAKLLVALSVWHTSGSARECQACLTEAGRTDKLIRMPGVGEYLIHDFAEYSQDADAVKERRRKTAERTRNWRTRGVTEDATPVVTDEHTGGQTKDVHPPSPETSAVTLASRERANPEPDPVSKPFPEPAPDPGPRSVATAGAAASRRDLVFEALCAIEGIDWRVANKRELGRIAEARGLAKQSGASPEQIALAAERWPEVMGDATRTAIGVMSRFQQLLHSPARSSGRTSVVEQGLAYAEKLRQEGR